MANAVWHCQFKPLRASVIRRRCTAFTCLLLSCSTAQHITFPSPLPQLSSLTSLSSSTTPCRAPLGQCFLQASASRSPETTQTPLPANSSPHPLARPRSSEHSANLSRSRPQNAAERSTTGYEPKRRPKRRINGSGRSKSSSWVSHTPAPNRLSCDLTGLLGQSESGKSTTLRNFQLQYAPQAFRAERATWKTVIQLNVIRSVRRMHKALSSLEDASTHSPTSPWSSAVSNKLGSVRLPGRSEDAFEYQHNQRRGNASRPTLTPKHRLLLMRLCPLLALEQTLVKQLTGNDPPPNIQLAPKSPGISLEGLFTPAATVRGVKPSWWGKEVPDEDLPPISPGKPDTSSEIYSRPSSRPSGSSHTNPLRRPAVSPAPPSPFSDASFATQIHEELSIQASSWNQRMGNSTPPRSSKGRLTTPQVDPPSSVDPGRVRRSSVSSQSPPSFVSRSPTPPLSRAPSVASFASTNSTGTSNGKPKGTFRLPNITMSMAIRRVRSSNSLKNSSPSSGNGKDSLNTKGSASADLVVSACAADIAELWRDTEVRLLLDLVFGISVEAEAGL